MNIMFFQRTYNIGGVNIVTKELANYFVNQGHRVSIFIFSTRLMGTEKMIDPRVSQYVGVDDCKYKKENVSRLHVAMNIEKPDLVVNNWGMPWIYIYTALRAQKGLNKKAKILSVYHNAPDANGRLQNIDIALMRKPILPKKIALKLARFGVKKLSAFSMRYVYNHSDAYQLLSPCYKDVFEKFVGIKNPKKVVVLTNPVTIDAGNFELDPAVKEKELIYVGRLDANQKKVFRIIDVWKILEKELDGWNLTIVGDGPERKNIEEKIEENGLKRVCVVGFKNARPYYERASIMLLASEYEGFPLVLAESMQFGCVPVVYGSFKSVYDIIENGKDGLVIPYNKDGFPTDDMAAMVRSICNSPPKMNQMMCDAVQKSSMFALEKIVKQWEEKVFPLCNKN